MIANFRDKETERLWQSGRCRNFLADVQRRAFIKLSLLNAAIALSNLTIPTGNRLEALHGDREGQRSIRINDQYRVCFVWRGGNTFDVEIADYH